MPENKTTQHEFNEALTEAAKIRKLALQFVMESDAELKKEYLKSDFLAARRRHISETGKYLTEEQWWEQLVAKHFPGVNKEILIANKELITQTKIEFINWESGIAKESTEKIISSTITIAPGVKNDQFMSSHFYNKAQKNLEKSLLDKVFSKLGSYIKNKSRRQ